MHDSGAARKGMQQAAQRMVRRRARALLERVSRQSTRDPTASRAPVAARPRRPQRPAARVRRQRRGHGAWRQVRRAIPADVGEQHVVRVAHALGVAVQDDLLQLLARLHGRCVCGRVVV
jgi:hypothetical protein